MKLISEGRKPLFLLFDMRMLIAISGLFLSVILHELLHIVLHWNYITHIYIFPHPYVIAEVEFLVAPGYNMLLEEVFAYAISTVVLIGTLTIILDTKSKRTHRTLATSLLMYARTAIDRATIS